MGLTTDIRIGLESEHMQLEYPQGYSSCEDPKVDHLHAFPVFGGSQLSLAFLALCLRPVSACDFSFLFSEEKLKAHVIQYNLI